MPELHVENGFSPRAFSAGGTMVNAVPSVHKSSPSNVASTFAFASFIGNALTVRETSMRACTVSP